MPLIIVPPEFVDYAWKDGAYLLGESCVEECTAEQLKMTLAQGQKILVRMEDEQGMAVGWGAYMVQQLPNLRALFITNLWARGAHFERFFAAIKDVAFKHGCSRIRCAALPPQARIFRNKCGFSPVYETLEVAL